MCFGWWHQRGRSQLEANNSSVEIYFASFFTPQLVFIRVEFIQLRQLWDYHKLQTHYCPDSVAAVPVITMQNTFNWEIPLWTVKPLIFSHVSLLILLHKLKTCLINSHLHAGASLITSICSKIYKQPLNIIFIWNICIILSKIRHVQAGLALFIDNSRSTLCKVAQV